MTIGDVGTLREACQVCRRAPSPSAGGSTSRRSGALRGGEYRIVVERDGDLDELRIELETDGTVPEAVRAELEAGLWERLMVRTGVAFVPKGTFEPQVFKARRVIDRRT